MTNNKSASAYSTAGVMLSAFGGISQAIGNFYAAKTEQYQANSKALEYDLAADIASMNAEQEEENALFAMQKGEAEIGALTMRSGQEAATARATMAANGVAVGVGSAAELMATNELMKQRDMLTINANRVRSAAEARMRASGFRGQAIAGRTTAANMLRTASTINPLLTGFTSLMGSAGQVAEKWYHYNNKATSSYAAD